MFKLYFFKELEIGIVSALIYMTAPCTSQSMSNMKVGGEIL